jgi:small subunit ribosomal protein S5
VVVGDGDGTVGVG